ncbi:uncharacterized protein LOC127569852 isoform X2 [Pristis pectinata]|uniref:uncharacterized protein LOC127569852 isoform X2 n=1 Tax=Pristis pectinata TaxID=685728 RepID=UPI00223CA2A2|nr:uncharacterized protein LOC127569852 isoform X2 [Pristis pectinata]
MQANTQTNLCFSPTHDDPKSSSKLKELSLICEEDSELSATDKPVPGGQRHLSQFKKIAQQKNLKEKRGIEPFWNRSPSLQRWKKFTQSSSRHATCSEPTEISSEFSLPSEAFPSPLPSVDSDLLVDSSSFARTDSCSSIELFREAEDHTSPVQLEDVGWFYCKNSTLLDSSKAANIDVIPQPSNLSEILEHTGNITRERSLKNHVTDGTEECGSSQCVSVAVAGKTITKLRPGIEQKRMHAISVPSKQKNIRQKHQDEVPLCSIILAPVCYRPAKVWQYEQLQPCTTFENAPLDIIITSPI